MWKRRPLGQGPEVQSRRGAPPVHRLDQREVPLGRGVLLLSRLQHENMNPAKGEPGDDPEKAPEVENSEPSEIDGPVEVGVSASKEETVDDGSRGPS